MTITSPVIQVTSPVIPGQAGSTKDQSPGGVYIMTVFASVSINITTTTSPFADLAEVNKRRVGKNEKLERHNNTWLSGSPPK